MGFYVYEWFNVDTGYIFCVGKGKEDRYKSLRNRNRYFLNYINKYNCDVRIVNSNLDNDEAYLFEKELIKYYKSIGQCKTNIAEGGIGGIRLMGKANPMYGRTWWNKDTPESKILEWKKNIGSSGDKNPMFGVSPQKRMSPEVYERWCYKHSLKVGKDNPNYGNKKLSKIYSNNPEYAKEKQGRPGKQNGRCVPVNLYDLNMNFIKSFDYYGECAEYLLSIGMQGTKKNNLAIKISQCKKSGSLYKGYYFK